MGTVRACWKANLLHAHVLPLHTVPFPGSSFQKYPAKETGNLLTDPAILPWHLRNNASCVVTIHFHGFSEQFLGTGVNHGFRSCEDPGIEDLCSVSSVALPPTEQDFCVSSGAHSAGHVAGLT